MGDGSFKPSHFVIDTAQIFGCYLKYIDVGYYTVLERYLLWWSYHDLQPTLVYLIFVYLLKI